MRRIWPVVRRVWITLGLGLTAVFIVWSLVAYRANAEGRSAASSGSVVRVDHQDGVWHFTAPGIPATAVTLVFFPGALVDPRAYAPLARSVAEAGYKVVLIELPWRGAFGGADSDRLASRIRSVLAAERDSARVVVAGHSRGAVVASRVAAENPQELSGLVLIGSSHPRDQDLSTLAMPVTKIVGTRDGLATPDEVRENAGLLPRHASWIWVEGGNHSQFGWYGFQPLDRRPRVDAATQQGAMMDAVLEILREAAAA